jgi:hypothetical protein
VQPGNTFIDGYSGKERTQAAKKPSGLLKRDPFGVSIDAVFPCGTASTGIRQHVKDNLVVDVSAFCAHVFDTSSYKPASSEHSRACARVWWRGGGRRGRGSADSLVTPKFATVWFKVFVKTIKGQTAKVENTIHHEQSDPN